MLHAVTQPLITVCKGVFSQAGALASRNIWQFHGGWQIWSIVGIVSVDIQAQATTCKLTATCDALTPVDLCTTLDINGKPHGTTFHLPAAITSPLVAAANGVATTLLTNPIYVFALGTTGFISVTYGAASSGFVNWGMLCTQLEPSATMVDV